MKKRKKSETARREFDHRPFKELKGLVRDDHAPAKGPGKERSAPRDSVDEADLFLRAVADVKRKGGPEEPAGKVERGLEAKRRKAREGEDRQVFLDAMRSPGPNFRDRLPAADEEEQNHSSAAGRMRQLRRGTIRISEELDLHGMLKDEALHRLGHFIASAHARGGKAVLVITGKGINSPEGPVLQGAVAAWLREQGKGMVVEFHPAPRDKGGSGAYVVFLRTKKS